MSGVLMLLSTPVSSIQGRRCMALWLPWCPSSQTVTAQNCSRESTTGLFAALRQVMGSQKTCAANVRGTDAAIDPCELYSGQEMHGTLATMVPFKSDGYSPKLQ